VKKFILLLILFLPLPVQAQQNREKFKPLDWSDGAYWTGATLDIVSSTGKRELNPLFRNAQGRFTPGKNLAFKAGLWGVFKLTEAVYDKPRERKIIRYFKLGAGVAWAVVAARNFAKERP
jgi:hypothetical protein